MRQSHFVLWNSLKKLAELEFCLKAITLRGTGCLSRDECSIECKLCPTFHCLQSLDESNGKWQISSGRLTYGSSFWKYKCLCALSYIVMFHSLRPHGLYSLPGSSVHGIFQARILEQVAIPFSGDLPKPRVKPRSPALQTNSLLSEPPGKSYFFIILPAHQWRHPIAYL